MLLYAPLIALHMPEDGSESCGSVPDLAENVVGSIES